MNKGKGLLLPLLLTIVLSSCQQSDIEEEKSEDSKVMDTVMNTVNKKDFLSASVDDTSRVVDLEIADTVNTSKLKKEINTQLKNQDIRPYTINVSQRDMDIVKIENRWDEIYSYIFEELFHKKGYKGFSLRAYIELSQPIRFAIYTPINSTDSGAKEFGKKIEKEIDNLLKTPQAKKWIENDLYTIEVYSQDNQKIN
ncbi:DUF4030 domain-containing protein [Bacillus pseudomycoides]|uniref:DUF4030 domain-containing protein n=2 Tax=Bacillus pseudomycoides TaxID=64104 RepID=UPI000BEE2566|nr:DUF4030 domain-containing protein [Bacillus pseudomycoides]PED05349.1 hypothetical protein COO19_26965 [Bacillus pseudomycoides]PEI84534.1 hypothetical protein CN686_28455 [Bacillus pseudomycoides]PEK07023.1 hypothetical protein CN693_28945 [Bacillus pseudomycoides]PEM61740.1 hypothetical protein CN619_30070 [Bacillus pseudomycoides]PEO04967.1 hypothetical protein CN542_28835 [Bacillus pseudomycoides]